MSIAATADEQLEGRPRSQPLRAREQARMLGVSEAELVASGGEAVRLRPAWRELLPRLPEVGGVMCLGAPEGASAADNLATIVEQAGLKNEAEARQKGNWTSVVRGRLPGSADWSHQYGNAANTADPDENWDLPGQTAFLRTRTGNGTLPCPLINSGGIGGGVDVFFDNGTLRLTVQRYQSDRTRGFTEAPPLRANPLLDVPYHAIRDRTLP